MAKVTTHTLNGANGTHAAGIPVTLKNCGTDVVLFTSQTDAGGRLTQDISASEVDETAIYELLFDLKEYWVGQGHSGNGTIPQIALRFSMYDADGEYHMPVILSPNTYSTWKSS